MDNIEGTWRFVRAMARDDVGNPRPSPYEGQGMGRIVIGDGRMAVMMIDWRHDIPGDQKREYSGYPKSGSWTIACVGRIDRTVGDGHISASASASPEG